MKEKKITIIDLPKFVCDDIHFNCKEVDGYNKPWNYVVCEREAGKSVLLWKKVYNAFKKEGAPSIILKRQIIDITEQDITDTITLLEKFVGTRLPFEYSKVDIKQGMMDLKLNGKVFVRFIALSAPMSRIKSKVLINVRYIMFDEFICNLRLGEKYLTDEPMRVKEVFTTYNRESERGIKCYFFGNPYSLYNPYFSWKNVNTRLLKPGALLSEDDYVVHCYQICDELKKQILAKNPLYQFDDAYKRYAFDGMAIQDTNIRLQSKQPDNFRLTYIFKLNNKCLGCFRGVNLDEHYFYWVKKINIEEVSKRRDIVCFDFGQMENGTVLMSNEYKKAFTYFREAIQKRQIVYQDIEASYLMEEIYQNM